LLKGKRRFTELLAAEEGIATNILSDRLRRLEDQGLIVRESFIRLFEEDRDALIESIRESVESA
jgi:DNA-binding HxlR family transcriptional regulator